MQTSIVLVHDAHVGEGRVDAGDTLLEAQAIAATLTALGYAPMIVPVDLDLGRLQRTLVEAAPRAVFNLVESLEGRGQLLHVVPALLEALGVPYTGCSAAALALTSHKLLAKQQLLRAGLPTPAIFTLKSNDEATWIVKSVWEHASLGIDDSSVVRGARAVPGVLDARHAEFGGDWFAERFIPGRELNVALIAADQGVRVLPVAEIGFQGFPADKPAIVGYAAKWHTDSFEYQNTRRSFDVEGALAMRAEQLALECWELFNLAGYARVDFRVDADGALWILEVNANPCLSPDAGFAAALAMAGVDYVTAIRWLLDDTSRRTTDQREV